MKYFCLLIYVILCCLLIEASSNDVSENGSCNSSYNNLDACYSSQLTNDKSNSYKDDIDKCFKEYVFYSNI